MASSFKIGRVFGVDIGVHWSWIFIFLVVTYSFATGVFDQFYPQWSETQKWIGGGLVAGVFFLSVLAHELSHAVVSNRSGLPVRNITLFIFGGVSNLTREPDSAALEFRIAIVGPLTSAALAIIFAAVWFALRSTSDGVAGISGNLALINGSLALFNMLPGFPLDGGRVFRSIVWARNHNRLRATRLASHVGVWIAYLVMAAGIAESIFFQNIGGLWLLFIGFFLRNASTASYEQLLIDTTLSGIHVRDVIRTNVDSVAPDVNVEELVHDHVLKRNARCFAVIAAGDFAGLITLSDIRDLPRHDWPTTSVYRAMTPASRLHTVKPEENLTTVLQLMAEHDVNQLPVVQGRELLGILDRADVMRFIQVRRDLTDGNSTDDAVIAAAGTAAGSGAPPETSPRP